MNVADLIGTPVLDLSTATTLGRVDDVVIDVGARRVRGFHLAKAAGGTWLDWTAIAAVGPDAVTVDAPHRVTEPPADVGPGCRRSKALGGRVLSHDGRELGSLAAVEFDTEQGGLVGLLVGDTPVPAERLLGIGTYATVVTEHTA